MSISLVVTDLDGTLWDNNGVVADSTKTALQNLSSAGIPVLAATARRGWTTSNIYRQNDIDLPTVLLNGALGRHAASRDTFFQRSIPSRVATVLVNIFEQNNLHPNVYMETDELDVVASSAGSSSPSYFERNKERLSIIDGSLSTVVATHESFMFSLVGIEQQGPLIEMRHEAIRIGCTAYVTRDSVYGGWTLDVVAPDISKWEGVMRYCEATGIDPANVLAVGDGNNDVDLLANARVSCAMGHGSEAAVDAASVLLPNGTASWCEILDHMT